MYKRPSSSNSKKKKVLLIAVIVFLLWFWYCPLWQGGHTDYEVRDSKARHVMCHIALRAGWQPPMFTINDMHTHQKITWSGLGYMYIDRNEEDRDKMFSAAAVSGMPSGNAASYSVFDPEAWANWAIEDFKSQGFKDAEVGYRAPYNRLVVVKCSSALGAGSVTFKKYTPLFFLSKLRHKGQ